MEEYTTVIKPKDKLWQVDFKEMWKYRDLYTLFVKRDVITQYKQTVLGPLWFIIQPLFTTVMYMFVFGGIAGISTDGLPQPVFYLANIVCWQYFGDCLNKTSSTFLANQGIFGKVYFPRLIIPLSNVTSNLVRMFIQLLLFTGFYLYFYCTGAPIKPNSCILLFPLLILMLAGLALGFGIIISSVTTKYRDLTILFAFVVQLWMYATPIIYPLSIMEARYAEYMWAVQLNPLTSIVETFRYAATGVGAFSWGALGYSFGFMAVLLVFGVVLFNKVQRSFMDTV